MTQTYSDPTYTKLISQGDELVKRIKQGLDSEHYATWAREGTWAVKKDLEIVSLMQYHLDTFENEVAYLLDTAVYKYRLSHSETMTFVRKYRDLRLEGHDIDEALELAQN